MKDNYPDGAANDPNAPYNQKDPEDLPGFVEVKREVWNERITDATGWMLDAITERTTEDLEILAKLIRDNGTGTHTITIGSLISGWVLEYTKPDTETVLSELERRP